MRTSWLAIALLIGCGTPEERDRKDSDVDLSRIDADGDGFMAHMDCDDDDPGRFPGNTELCDGIDQDCSGIADDGVPVDGLNWYPDDDGDGYGDGSEPPTVACHAPEQPGAPIRVLDDRDCDDSDPDIHPGLYDRADDGIDRNCDGGDANSPGCLDPIFFHMGDVEIATEADANAFCYDHNGVVGSIRVVGTELETLAALDCLCRVEGGVEITDNDLLVSLDLGDSFLEVTGDLVLERNAVLEELGSNVYFAVGGDVVARDLPSMTTSQGGVEGLVDASVLEGDLIVERAHIELESSVDEIRGDVVIREPVGHAVLNETDPSFGNSGVLTIGGSLEVTDADQAIGAAGLYTIGGDLRLENSDADFDLLLSVGGDLEVYQDGDHILSFERLDDVGGNLILIGGDATNDPFPPGPSYNNPLVIDPFTIGGSLMILDTNHDELPIERLASIGGDLVIHGNDRLGYNAWGSSFNNDPITVGGDVDIAGNTAFGNSGFGCGLVSRVTSVGGSVRIVGNDHPCSVQAPVIPGDLLIAENGWGTVGSGATVEVGGSVEIRENEWAENVYLNSLETVGWDVYIAYNGGAVELEMGSLVDPGPAGLTITGNDDMVVLGTVGPLSAGTDLGISGNDQLADISGLSAVTALGRVTLSYNPALTSLTGLDGLTEVDDLFLFRLHGLADLTGLGNLQDASHVDIDDCDGLLALDGAENLATMSSLWIYNNDQLASVSGLTGVTAIYSSFHTAANPMLPEQDVWDWLAGIPTLGTTDVQP